MVHHYFCTIRLTFADENYLFTLQFDISAYIVYERHNNMIKNIDYSTTKQYFDFIYFTNYIIIMQYTQDLNGTTLPRLWKIDG